MGARNDIASLSGIGARICEMRKSRGMTQAQLAGGDVTRNMLSRIENGAALPSLPTLCALASRLDVPIGALLGDIAAYKAYKAQSDMRELIKKQKYADVIEYYDSIDTLKSEDTSMLFAKACICRAWELYRTGKLNAALDLLGRAKEAGGEYQEIFPLSSLILSCGALEQKEHSSVREELLRSIIFDKNDIAIYLYALGKIGDIAARPYSQPSETAAPLLSELRPIINGLSEGFYKTHIEAKFDMLSAEYLSAKSKLMTLVSPDTLPALLWAVYTDLEFCCKCCGDFENAYRYSGLRLELIKKLN